MSELSVKFQRFDEGREVRPTVLKLAFSIEPPIVVHDKDIIDNAAEPKKDSIVRGYGLPAPADEIIISHSDNEATYGTYLTNEFRVSGKTTEETEELKTFLQENFEEALNPMGNVAIAYIFLSDKK